LLSTTKESPISETHLRGALVQYAGARHHASLDDGDMQNLPRRLNCERLASLPTLSSVPHASE